MAKYYKLIDAENSSHMLNLPVEKNGMGVYERFVLHPGQKYTEHIDDPVFMKALLNDVSALMDYTEERKRALDACGARYEELKTGCCGGRKKLRVWLVEVVE